MPNPLPADRIAEAREIIARATDGPWTVDRGEDWSEDYPRNITIRCPCSPPGSSRQVAKMSGGGMPYMDPDAEFIAAARTGWPEALDALESAQSRAERAEKALADARGAVQLALNRALAGLASDGTPERGAVVEAECPHDGDEECPWSDMHEAIRTYRTALTIAAAALAGDKEGS